MSPRKLQNKIDESNVLLQLVFLFDIEDSILSSLVFLFDIEDSILSSLVFVAQNCLQP